MARISFQGTPRTSHGCSIVHNRLISKHPAQIDAATRSLRTVHRAASDLRRGTPVLLHDGGNVMVIAAAETVGVGGLAEIAACASGPSMLLVAPIRAAALMRTAGFPAVAEVVPPAVSSAASAEAVALPLPPALLDPEMLRGLADPTIEAPLPGVPEPVRGTTPPSLAGSALALAKLARLLPAVVAAPAQEEPNPELLTV